jgi:TetR/AcrR family transcriptional regulator, transcriptional repressor for nem operon
MAKDSLEGGETASLILDAAERLIAIRGFNGFSYGDAAQELGMTRAALHYHFSNKADLGEALIARYSARFADALEAIDARELTALAKIEAYAGLYFQVLQEGRMCLCGMLAAERETLPPAMQDAVNRYFIENQCWLSLVLTQGAQLGTIELSGSPDDVAWMVINTLEGAMLLARIFNDVTILQSSAEQLLMGLKPGTRVEA